MYHYGIYDLVDNCHYSHIASRFGTDGLDQRGARIKEPVNRLAYLRLIT